MAGSSDANRANQSTVSSVRHSGVNPVRTCLVQVPRQLDRRLHLHVVLEEAAAERGLVVGLPRRGLDGRLHPGLRHGGGDDPDAPHGRVVFRPVRHRVLLLRAKPGAKRPVLVPDAVRKHPLEALQRVAAQPEGVTASRPISVTRRPRPCTCGTRAGTS